MENGRFYRFMSKRVTAWSKQPMPGWWTMFTIVGIGVLFVYFAYSIIDGSHQTHGPTLPPLSSSGAPSTTDSPQPSSPASRPGDGSPSSAPATGGQSTVPAPAGEKTMKVYGPHGQVVAAPTGAVTVAHLALEALYDARAAAEVPTSSGTPHQPPATQAPGQFTDLTWTNPSAGTSRMRFTAMVDPDGPAGPINPTLASVTIARLGGDWVYLDTAN